ncbi:MAG TPA: hypothetical protein VHG08_18455 [Longimicrobium sp.]|nr:hypothetical protein [Longimicrobium sp.]
MRRFRPGSIRGMAAVLAAAACAACGQERACELGAMADTTGWQVFDAGPFVFKLPPGYRDDYPIGTDSYAGLWTQGERSITFSWGPHTADPRDPPRNPAAPPLCRARIGGRTALVSQGARGPDSARRYFVGAWWERPDTLGANLYVGGYGPASDSAGRAVATTVVRTVRLRTVWSPQDSARFTWRLCEISRVNHPPSGVEEAAPSRDPRNCPATRPPPAAYDRVR